MNAGTTAVRPLFERRGDDARLLAGDPAGRGRPAGRPARRRRQHAGFAVRFYGDDGALVYRRAMHDPLVREAEICTDDPERLLRAAWRDGYTP